MTTKSAFLAWFVEQHKGRTNSGMPNHTDQQLRDMAHAGRVADRVLACRELWDEKQQSALYAWQESMTSALKGAGSVASSSTTRPAKRSHVASVQRSPACSHSACKSEYCDGA